MKGNYNTNYHTFDGKPPKIIFENHIQQILYECEMKGLISDGMWENSKPYDHWHIMCDATTSVDSEGLLPRMNFKPKRRYNFNDDELFEAIGDRMLWEAKCIIYFPPFTPEQIDLLEYLLPEYLELLLKARITEENTYWVEKRHELKLLLCCETEGDDALKKTAELIDAVDYSVKELRNELKRMGRIVNERK